MSFKEKVATRIKPVVQFLVGGPSHHLSVSKINYDRILALLKVLWSNHADEKECAGEASEVSQQTGQQYIDETCSKMTPDELPKLAKFETALAAVLKANMSWAIHNNQTPAQHWIARCTAVANACSKSKDTNGGGRIDPDRLKALFGGDARAVGEVMGSSPTAGAFAQSLANQMDYKDDGDAQRFAGFEAVVAKHPHWTQAGGDEPETTERIGGARGAMGKSTANPFGGGGGAGASAGSGSGGAAGSGGNAARWKAVANTTTNQDSKSGKLDLSSVCALINAVAAQQIADVINNANTSDEFSAWLQQNFTGPKAISWFEKAGAAATAAKK